MAYKGYGLRGCRPRCFVLLSVTLLYLIEVFFRPGRRLFFFFSFIPMTPVEVNITVLGMNYIGA